MAAINLFQVDLYKPERGKEANHFFLFYTSTLDVGECSLYNSTNENSTAKW